MRPRPPEVTGTRRDSRRLVLCGLAFAIAGASCAYVFPDYDLEDGGAAAAGGRGGGGSGGTGGEAPLAPPGSPCDSNGECSDGHCLPSNDGAGKVCCAITCSDMGPDSCGTNGKCDPGGDVCASYPAGTICGGSSCSFGLEAEGMLTVEQCQAGTCAPGEPTLCAGGLACEDETSCKDACDVPEDCADPDATCPSPGNEFCESPAGVACDAAEECASGICGTTGEGGHCCTEACDSTGVCGAVDCGATGGCVFANEQTPCGSMPECDDGKLVSEFCDGSGECGTERAQQPCPGKLRCESPLACYETCGANDATGDARCISGHWCDGSTCRPSSWDERTACTRDAQCRSNACVDGTCAGVDCDVDGDGHDRADEECGGTDCDDDDARVFVGQTEFYDMPRSIGSFDFDCDGKESPLYPTRCGCSGSWQALFVPAGDEGCGQTGNLRKCELLFVCYVGAILDSSTTQSCR